MVLAIWVCCTNYTVGGSLTVFLSKKLGGYVGIWGKWGNYGDKLTVGNYLWHYMLYTAHCLYMSFVLGITTSHTISAPNRVRIQHRLDTVAVT